MKFPDLAIKIFILTGSALLFIPFLGNVHLFDWDEINFAECAREMIVTGEYSRVMINYQPFWEKPPLFFWLQAISMNIIGVNELAARLPNAICGTITLLMLFNIGTKLYDKQFGLLWVLAYAGSFLPHFYFKSGIIDPWFNLFIFSGIYYFVVYTYNDSETKVKNKTSLFLSALFTGLAIMSKGPVALLIVGLCFIIYFLLSGLKKIISIRDLFIYGCLVAFTGSLWFIIEISGGRYDIVVEFFEYQVRLFKTKDAGHGGPFFYHFLVLLIGCFPASIIAARALTKTTKASSFQHYFKKWMIILFWVVLILFSIVKTKIVHYSSLCYFPLTFLAAYGIYKIHHNELTWKKWMTWLIAGIGIIIGSAITLFPFLDKYKSEIIASGIIKDDFAIANLQADVYWNGWEFMVGILFIIGIISGIVLINKEKIKEGYISLCIATLITVNLTSLLYVPKIEQYSQNAAIEFYESLETKDCYIMTLGFKSYAHLFYGKGQPGAKPKMEDDGQWKEWLLNGPIDKPAYFAAKITTEEEIKSGYPQLKELYRKNGFVFYERPVD